MKNKNALIGILIGLVIILLAYNIYFTNRSNNLLKGYQFQQQYQNNQINNKENELNPPQGFQFEVPTGQFLNTNNDVKPELLCDKDTKPWIKVVSPNGGEIFNIKPEISKERTFEEVPAGKIPVSLKSCNVSDDGYIRLMLLDEANNQESVSMVGYNYGYFNQNSFVPVGSKSGKYKVLVELNDANKYVVSQSPIYSDTSDNFFTINIK